MGLAIVITNAVLWLANLVFLFLSMYYQLDRTLSFSIATLFLTSLSCMFWFDEHNFNFWTSILFFGASIIGVGFVVVSFFTENPIPL